MGMPKPLTLIFVSLHPFGFCMIVGDLFVLSVGGLREKPSKWC